MILSYDPEFKKATHLVLVVRNTVGTNTHTPTCTQTHTHTHTHLVSADLAGASGDVSRPQ